MDSLSTVHGRLDFLDSGRLVLLGTYSGDAGHSSCLWDAHELLQVMPQILIKRTPQFPFQVRRRIMRCKGLGNPLGVCARSLRVATMPYQNGKRSNFHLRRPTLHDLGGCPI